MESKRVFFVAHFLMEKIFRMFFCTPEKTAWIPKNAGLENVSPVSNIASFLGITSLNFGGASAWKIWMEEVFSIVEFEI